MIARRQFIFGLGALLVRSGIHLSGVARWASSVRVGVGGDETPALRAGLDFGFTEGARTAQLLGWDLERISLASPTAVDRSGLSAIIVTDAATDLAAQTIPVITVRCGRAADGVLHLAPCRAGSSAGADSRIVAWHSSLERFGAGQLNARYLAATGRAMDDDGWLGWFSVKVLTEAAMRARSADGRALRAYLRSPAARFDGHKGAPLYFDRRGELVQPLYQLRRRGADWTVEREILETVP